MVKLHSYERVCGMFHGIMVILYKSQYNIYNSVIIGNGLLL